MIVSALRRLIVMLGLASVGIVMSASAVRCSDLSVAAVFGEIGPEELFLGFLEVADCPLRTPHAQARAPAIPMRDPGRK